MTINSNDQRAILEDPESIRMIGVYESADCKEYWYNVFDRIYGKKEDVQ